MNYNSSSPIDPVDSTEIQKPLVPADHWRMFDLTRFPQVFKWISTALSKLSPQPLWGGPTNDNSACFSRPIETAPQEQVWEVGLSTAQRKQLEVLQDSGVNLDDFVVAALTIHKNQLEQLEDDMDVIVEQIGRLKKSANPTNTQQFLNEWNRTLMKMGVIVQKHIRNGRVPLAGLFLELTCMWITELPESLLTELCLGEVREKFNHVPFRGEPE